MDGAPGPFKPGQREMLSSWLRLVEHSSTLSPILSASPEPAGFLLCRSFSREGWGAGRLGRRRVFGA